MEGFDTVAVVDWSARSVPSPAKPTKDAIFIGICRGGAVATVYQRTRDHAMRTLRGLIDGELRAGRRVLLAFDFPFAYPTGFARAVTGDDAPLALWEHFAEVVEDDDRNGNNRFAVAAGLNARFGPEGPFWGHPPGDSIPGVPFRKPDYAPFPFAERREIERLIPRSKPCFQLMGAGSVGSQALLGIARLQSLRQRYGADLSVAPFEAPQTPVVLAECYPGLLARTIDARSRAGEIPDRAQVRVMAWALGRLAADRLDTLLRAGHPVEGWILGQGAEGEIAAALP